MPDEQAVRIMKVFERAHQELYPEKPGGMTFTTFLLKAIEATGKSRQEVTLGRKEHPFNFESTALFKNYNVHHSACIEAKKESTVGLGFWPENWEAILDEIHPVKRRMMLRQTPSKVERILGPLCDISFLDLQLKVDEDYWQTGNGYIEVVRRYSKEEEGQSPIVGLHHMSSTSTFVYVEDGARNYHYETGLPVGDMGISATGTPEKRFAKFGDYKDFIKRNRIQSKAKQTVSEVIRIQKASSLSPWYGIPAWISAVAAIELVQCINQHNFDFFLNRGVPEFMLFLLGGKQIKSNDWEKIEKAVQAHIGLGNAYKSFAIHLDDPSLKVQLEKLAMDSKEGDGFKDKKDTLALDIVSAHRVPPLLAGIQIPGKMGATNELPNALMAFQHLAIAPAQADHATVYGNTLGNPELSGGLDLKPEDFLYRTILDEIDIKQADTMSRMKEPLETAQSEGRNLDDGLKD